MGQYYFAVILNEENAKEGVLEVENWFDPESYGSGKKLMSHAYLETKLTNVVMKHLFKNPQPLIWVGDYSDTGLYQIARDNCPSKELLYVHTDYDKYNKYIVNYSKGLYVMSNTQPKDADGWQIHPLPLLTSNGNGMGGGDYHGTNMRHVGSWSTDLIATYRNRKHFPTRFKKIELDFVEGKESEGEELVFATGLSKDVAQKHVKLFKQIAAEQRLLA